MKFIVVDSKPIGGFVTMQFSFQTYCVFSLLYQTVTQYSNNQETQVTRTWVIDPGFEWLFQFTDDTVV